jgi:2-aminoadipate transaminase
VMEKIVLGKQAADLCTSTLTQYFVREYFGEGRWRDYIADLVEIYRSRRDVMLEALAENFPAQAEWTHPEGGLFVWATLPDQLDAKAMVPRALGARVAYVPGTGFYADGSGTANLRLNFSYCAPDRIREGVRRLAGVVEQELSLRSVFGALPASPSSDPPASLLDVAEAGAPQDGS